MCNYIRIIARKAQELGDVSWVPTQPFIWKHLVYIGTLDEKETVFQWIWFSFCLVVFFVWVVWSFFWWMWLWCHHRHYIPVSKEYSSNLKAPCPHRSWLFLACHTSTCTLARNKTAPASNFLAFVSIKQSCNSILNRMLTLFFFFFPVVLWKKPIRIQLSQGGEMEKKIEERCKWSAWGSRREMKPVIRLNFIKVTELADRPHHHLRSFEKTGVFLVLWLAVTLQGPVNS